VRDLDVAAPQRPQQLVLVVADHGQAGALGHHAHDPAQHPGDVRPPVDEVADEDHPAALGVSGRPAVGVDLVAELGQQRDQLVVAAVDVAHDVERTVLVAAIGPGPLALDHRALDLVDRAQHGDPAEALAGQAPEAAVQLLALAPHDVVAEVAVGPPAVALEADRLGHVEHHRHGQHVVGPRHLDQRPASLALDVGGVDHREPAPLEPLAGDVVQHVERVAGGRLVVLVVGHERPAPVRREHLAGPEVPGRERRLARSRGADQHHQAQLGDGDAHPGRAGRPDIGGRAHRANTAIWVGGPTSGSSGPTGRCSTW
jgi:hypothetical protein